MRHWLIAVLLCTAVAAPAIPGTVDSKTSGASDAFKLAENPIQPVVLTQTPDESGGAFMRVIETVAQHPFVSKLWKFVEDVAGRALQEAPKIIAEATTTATTPSTTSVRSLSVQRRFALDDEQKFRASFSHDVPVSVVQQDAIVPHKVTGGKISDHAWSKTLFGERGVLTEVFHVLDEQRRAAEANAPPHSASSHQSDSPATIGSFDLKKIFDSIFMGTSKTAELGDPGPELPEFLGICNRISCGDIYKAIDQFRKSEFFSNFQMALQLIQDPKGWEIIGKALENPELISEFTGSAGLKELFGSALGETGDKAKENEKRKTEITSEDGDFGTDFTSLIESKPKNKPDISFSIDHKPAKQGGEDYYTEIAKGDNIDEDIVDIPEIIEKVETIPPSRKIEKSDVLPELSFSTDEEEGEEIVIEKSIDIAPPKKTVDVVKPKASAIERRFIVPSTTSTQNPIHSMSTTSRTFTTTRPATQASRTYRITTMPTTTTTKRNYRKDDDYYAMYYD